MNPFKMMKAMLTSAPRITPAEAAPRLRKGEAVLIDVREPNEWTGGVAEGAVLLSLSDLTGARAKWSPFLADEAGRELLLYCQSGGRSGIAARILAAEGFRTANAGGVAEWTAAGWPVVRPTKSGE